MAATKINTTPNWMIMLDEFELVFLTLREEGFFTLFLFFVAIEIIV